MINFNKIPKKIIKNVYRCTLDPLRGWFNENTELEAVEFTTSSRTEEEVECKFSTKNSFLVQYDVLKKINKHAPKLTHLKITHDGKYSQTSESFGTLWARGKLGLVYQLSKLKYLELNNAFGFGGLGLEILRQLKDKKIEHLKIEISVLDEDSIKTLLAYLIEIKSLKILDIKLKLQEGCSITPLISTINALPSRVSMGIVNYNRYSRDYSIGANVVLNNLHALYISGINFTEKSKENLVSSLNFNSLKSLEVTSCGLSQEQEKEIKKISVRDDSRIIELKLDNETLKESEMYTNAVNLLDDMPKTPSVQVRSLKTMCQKVILANYDKKLLKETIKGLPLEASYPLIAKAYELNLKNCELKIKEEACERFVQEINNRCDLPGPVKPHIESRN